MIKSTKKCPRCAAPLHLEKGKEKTFLVYCGRGSCQSTVSNEGREGDTEGQAYRLLRDAIEKEFESVVEEDE